MTGYFRVKGIAQSCGISRNGRGGRVKKIQDSSKTSRKKFLQRMNMNELDKKKLAGIKPEKQ